jgi:hypothetical protein
MWKKANEANTYVNVAKRAREVEIDDKVEKARTLILKNKRREMKNMIIK